MTLCPMRPRFSIETVDGNRGSKDSTEPNVISHIQVPTNQDNLSVMEIGAVILTPSLSAICVFHISPYHERIRVLHCLLNIPRVKRVTTSTPIHISTPIASHSQGGLIGPENIQPLVSIPLKIFLAQLNLTVPLVKGEKRLLHWAVACVPKVVYAVAIGSYTNLPKESRSREGQVESLVLIAQHLVDCLYICKGRFLIGKLLSKDHQVGLIFC
ncbi:hypothetical protein E2C01_052241 [Portunus trituberculatus]|uniref:Uncharacterized protein n=1 Tax=Portunus trituberculatus TaxID=210409 RepID=A0A5B7GLE4_PORTR|nr:hypothetical protein [Portunus trituberculatus]